MCESAAVCKDDEMIAVDDNDVWRESRVRVQICVVFRGMLWERFTLNWSLMVAESEVEGN